MKHLALLLVTLCCAWTLSARAAAPAAQVAELEGRAIALGADGHTRTLAIQAPVYAGDTVATLGRARALLRFTDGSKYELGADTRLRIDRYRYGGQPDEAEAATEIVKGLFRYVSGLIAKHRPRATQIRTAVATIGIRGTHVIGEITETSATIGLLPPETGDAPSAIEVSNAHGSVTIDQPNYVTEIPDANSPPSPPRPRDLRSMTRQLRLVQTMRRVITPRMPALP
ncbi:MAG TPA: FecR domain-containing protein [Gammaproteobacteria bacterium]|nr:FecR domain-containing protein [Gammaproteobacteria bacterium]